MKPLKFFLKVIACGLLMGSIGCLQRNADSSDTKRAWNDANDPYIALYFTDAKGQTHVKDLERNFFQLSRYRYGQAKQQPWSADYWPHVRGGLGIRWQSNVLNYGLYSIDKLKKMNQKQIAALSPAEKLDIYLRRYDYPFTNSERNKVKPDASGVKPQDWWGICHGWSAAAVNEPRPGSSIVLKNADGISVTFYQDDIKGLLSRSYSEGLTSLTLGERCNDTKNMADLMFNTAKNNHPCWDANPGALHIVMVNLLGIAKQSFVIEVDRGPEVWNQPLYSYSFSHGKVTKLTPQTYKASSRAKASRISNGTVYTVDVKMTIRYLIEHQGSAITPRPNELTAIELFYSLDLDENNQIIGGEWLPNNQYSPDFFWFPPATPSYNDPLVPYATVKDILNKSLKNSAPRADTTPINTPTTPTQPITPQPSAPTAPSTPSTPAPTPSRPNNNCWGDWDPYCNSNI